MKILQEPARNPQVAVSTIDRACGRPAKSVSKEPDSKAFEHWVRLTSHGCFEQAWQLNDRRGSHWPSAHRLWDGRPSLATIANLRSLHGLGDAVQMLRYVPALRSLGLVISFDMPPLEPLLPYFAGTGDAATRGAASLSRANGRTLEIELMELPYFFRTRVQQLPLEVKYLSLPPRIALRQRACMGGSRKERIGIVWSGGDWDRDRWIEPSLLRPLLEDNRFEWWNLKGGVVSTGLKHPSLRTTQDLARGGLVVLAATIANLDLVLTVDTLAAHLAGALGVPTWLMLKQHADWRWLIGRKDSPWYPSIRIFRQPEPGDWMNVVEQVREALRSR